MERYAAALKALGHIDRLRILALLSQGELTVSELVQILSLSQPRVTQYINSLEAVGFIERLREGSWVFSRLRRGQAGISAIMATAIANLPESDPVLAADARRLADVREARSRQAEAFFSRVANDRGQLGDEYLPQSDIEAALAQWVGGARFDFMIDLGTGTGRMLEVFAPHIGRGVGVDASVEMLRVARHKLADDRFAHISVQQGDLHSTPFGQGVADLVTLHQVLHYLDDPEEAILEAARLLGAGGQLLLVDFEQHQREEFRETYNHRRLGFGDVEIRRAVEKAGLSLGQVQTISAPSPNSPAVKIWSAQQTSQTLTQGRL